MLRNLATSLIIKSQNARRSDETADIEFVTLVLHAFIHCLVVTDQ